MPLVSWDTHHDLRHLQDRHCWGSQVASQCSWKWSQLECSWDKWKLWSCKQRQTCACQRRSADLGNSARLRIWHGRARMCQVRSLRWNEAVAQVRQARTRIKQRRIRTLLVTFLCWFFRFLRCYEKPRRVCHPDVSFLSRTSICGRFQANWRAYKPEWGLRGDGSLRLHEGSDQKESSCSKLPSWWARWEKLGNFKKPERSICRRS